MRKLLAVLAMAFFVAAAGCAAPVIIAGGAVAGGFKVATDERSAGVMVDDSTLSTRVKSALVEDPEVKARNIDVDTVKAVVYLTGMVDTSAEAERAAAVAAKVAGVKRVESGLQVGTRRIGQVVDDKIISSKIKSKLIAEPGVRSLNIDVDVVKGMVTLTGVVTSGAQRERIIAIVQAVKGIAGVVNNLQINN